MIPPAEPDHTDVTTIGVVGDSADLAAAQILEREFLTALVWTDQDTAAGVVAALVGKRDQRDPADTDVIPLASALFLTSAHEVVFAAIVDLIDHGTPATVTLLQSHILTSDTAARVDVRRLLLDMASPPGRTPLPAELPHLGIALVDAWYRRGYIALVGRMSTVIASAAATDLAAHWAALTGHQQLAEQRRLHVIDRLTLSISD
ncbi:hypothetical protein GII33_22775 (plasmid) [Gordonia pseudamarae]|jgi:hypothetical protein|uniref:hypothetical protein n=1 Tax=Gordonia pseudamarae TaxID=2831662 RepID=UPI001AF3547F|nr:hypothetical protein [Gordonia pseudamarae]QHN28920.1 hypothetical protein GII33_22775 [Gordonia pseudamarae]